MNSALASREFQTDSPVLEFLSGTQKGTRVPLRGTRLSLGRSPENDVVLDADGVSRRHAFMAVSEGDWFIRDNDSKNGIVVNGAHVRESWVRSGDVIQLGECAFRFIEAGGDGGGGALANPMTALGVSNESEGLPILAASSPGRAAPNRRLLIYGGVGIVLVGLYLILPSEKQPDAQSEGATAEKGTEQLARDFSVSKKPDTIYGTPWKPMVGAEDPLLKKAEQQMASLDWSDKSLQQAEAFFRRGQREYMARNRHRAIEYFQSAISLYRGHALAERYLRLCVYETEIEAKNHMGQAIQYFESLQYARAIYHFQQVQLLMVHRPDEPINKEAKRYIEQATLRLRAAELFP